MKMNEDARLLAKKREIDEARRQKAIDKRRQEMLRATTPGLATPLSVTRFVQNQKFQATR